MISAYLQGGLGNQLFQIAAAVSLAEDYSDSAAFNTKHHDLPFQGRKCENYLGSIFRNLDFSSNYQIQQVYREPHFHYSKIPYLPEMCIVGYFQSEKYFQHNKEIVQNLFTSNEEIESLIKEKYGSVLLKNPTSVHIRRGDYLGNPNAHPVCSMEYYDNALRSFSNDQTFLLFSDDIEWCKKEFKEDNFYFVEDNEDVVDLFLMSKCSNNIIANSSFSWWAAWLNMNENKRVVAPKSWFGESMNNNTKDLIPPEWEII